MRSFIRQFFRHSLVGGTAFAIDYGLLIALTEIAGLYYLWSAILSFVVSVVFNYRFSMRFVFQRRTDISTQAEFIIFVMLSDKE
jgi:putative flippase GtrA